MALGMIAQALARHMRLPGIVLLLGAGVLFGPDLLALIDPEPLGSGLQILVGFAVAVILFDGGLNLNLTRLRSNAATIRRLLTIGALVTAAGGAVAAHYLMGWEWRLSLLFGTLVIVTGPTVVTPLLRRIKVRYRVETVLEAEGVLIDPIGAVIAVVALQVALAPSGSGFIQGAVDVMARIGFGLLAGAASGFLLALLLRVKRVIPDGLENMLTLSLVLAMYQLSNLMLPESGIATVTAAGLVVGNMRTHTRRELLEFKEQLTTLLIGMLFVLLAADVRLVDVQALGLPGLWTVAALMFVVRPINVALATWGSRFTWRDRLFLSWLSPRGVVAAAVASLFAQEIAGTDPEGAIALRALVFMTIAITVLVQGLTGGWVAGWLGLRRIVDQGVLILGANELGHTIGRLLREKGEDVVFIDSSPQACKVVESDGFRVKYGNALDDRILRRAQLEDRGCAIALTANEGINLLFARKAIEEYKLKRVYLAVGRHQAAVEEEIVHQFEGRVLFGRPRDMELWAVRLRKRTTQIEPWRLTRTLEEDGDAKDARFNMPEADLLPLIVENGTKVVVTHSNQKLRKGDVVTFAIYRERREAAETWLRETGYEPVEATKEGTATSP
jgi:NhaP-type Na+/H+ or K+/H+ antiporter